jgi:hypothetical protein
MGKTLRFVFEFEDEGPKTISYQIPPGVRVETDAEDGAAILYANKMGFKLLAEICAKLALGSYESGFHAHFSEGMEPLEEREEILRLVLDERK